MTFFDTSAILYLDDKSKYILVGYCVTQNGQRLDLPDLTIKTAYTTGRIYANLTIKLNKLLAENTIYAEMVNLVGSATNGEPIYIEGEKIDLKSIEILENKIMPAYYNKQNE